MRKYPALILLILLSVLPAHARSRTGGEALKQAAALEARGDLKQALGLYRAIYAQYSRRADILYRLQALLSRMEQYDEAVSLLRAHLKRAPRDITALLRLGNALYALGRQDAAFDAWDRIPEGAVNSAPYTRVAKQYEKHNLYARAAATYRKGREALGDPYLFARELAELAERQARYPETVAEYLLFLQEKPQYLPLVESRFRKFAREGDQQERIFSLLTEEIQKHPTDNARLSLYTQYALAAGYAASALKALTEGAAQSPRHRTLLFQIASHALTEAEYTTAAAAYQALVNRPNKPAHLPRALLGLGRAQGGRGLSDEARRLYGDLIERYPTRPETDEARFRLGRLLNETYRDPKEALQSFQDLVKTGRRTPWRYRALFEIAEIMLRTDRFADAVASCTLIARERRGQQEADEARFRMAEIRFLSGDFDAAQKLLSDLLSGPATRYALNDALALSVLIQDGHQTDPRALEAYAAALKLTRQQHPEAALKAFQDLLDRHPTTNLSDRALARQIELLEGLERYPEAIGLCRRLTVDLPWSPLCPWAQMALARIYGDRLGQVYDARKAYETLLIDYPRSLEADVARDRLRVLQKKIEELDTRQKETG